MSLAATVKAMADAGCSATQIAAVVAAHEAETERKVTEKRAADKVLRDKRPPEREWRRLVSIVCERDSYTCTYCGTLEGPFTADHVIPIARGGSNELDNLACSCRPCNWSKCDRLISEWRQQP